MLIGIGWPVWKVKVVEPCHPPTTTSSARPILLPTSAASTKRKLRNNCGYESIGRIVRTD